MASRDGAVVLDLQRRIDDISRRRRKRPFVTLTYAQSLDGSISAVRGQPLRLSGDASMVMTHRLRAMHDGIMVGVATMIADNPSLTVRLVPGDHPRPLILDSTLRTPLDCKLLTSDSCVKPIILTTSAALEVATERRNALLAAGAELIGCASTPDGHVHLGDALLRLPTSCRSVMVEGGAAVISSLISSAACAQGSWIDYLLLTVAPVVVGGLHGASRFVCAIMHRFAAQSASRAGL
jgi:GTP cyclohydrolase II